MNIQIYRQNGEKCRPWPDCSFRSSVFMVYTVCTNLSGWKLRIITVLSIWHVPEFVSPLIFATLATKKWSKKSHCPTIYVHLPRTCGMHIYFVWLQSVFCLQNFKHTKTNLMSNNLPICNTIFIQMNTPSPNFLEKRVTKCHQNRL